MNALIALQPFAVLCPDGASAWWIDSALIPESKYQLMLLNLLDEVAEKFPVSAEPTKTIIMGWSMGGFGAVRFAQDHRERIGAVATIMALVDFPNSELTDDQNYGMPAVLADTTIYSRYNCLKNAEQLRGLPLLQIAPTGAFDFTMNRNFHARLTELCIAHDYREIPGNHDWETVQNAMPQMLKFAVEQFPTNHR